MTDFDEDQYSESYWRDRPDNPKNRKLARKQSCGCILCTCEEEQCQNCGAKYCGTHDDRADKIPNPIYEKRYNDNE